MRKDKFLLRMNQEEYDYIIYCLIEMKNRLIREGGYADAVDEALLKLIKSKPSYA